MRAQYALMTPGSSATHTSERIKTHALGLIVMFVALSPMFAVSGFMLAQILGYVAR